MDGIKPCTTTSPTEGEAKDESNYDSSSGVSVMKLRKSTHGEQVYVASEVSESEEEDETAQLQKELYQPPSMSMGLPEEVPENHSEDRNSKQQRDTSTCRVSKPVSLGNNGSENRSQISEAESSTQQPISGHTNTKRKKWTQDEVKAVEDKLMDYITSGRVPGKRQCEECIRSAPEALRDRTWEAIKFYVKNRIVALQRESKKR
nr:uncharacterized protein LOC111835652 [Paramormyrops kingsleyae]